MKTHEITFTTSEALYNLLMLVANANNTTIDKIIEDACLDSIARNAAELKVRFGIDLGL